jgi:hypothetical protein
LTSYYWRLKGNALQAIGKKNSINLLIRWLIKIIEIFFL